MGTFSEKWMKKKNYFDIIKMKRENKVKCVSYAILMTLTVLSLCKIVIVAIVKLVTLPMIIWWREHVSYVY